MDESTLFYRRSKVAALATMVREADIALRMGDEKKWIEEMNLLAAAIQTEVPSEAEGLRLQLTHLVNHCEQITVAPNAQCATIAKWRTP